MLTLLCREVLRFTTVVGSQLFVICRRLGIGNQGIFDRVRAAQLQRDE